LLTVHPFANSWRTAWTGGPLKIPSQLFPPKGFPPRWGSLFCIPSSGFSTIMRIGLVTNFPFDKRTGVSKVCVACGYLSPHPSFLLLLFFRCWPLNGTSWLVLSSLDFSLSWGILMARVLPLWLFQFPMSLRQ